MNFFGQCAGTAHHLSKIVGLEQIMRDLLLFHKNQLARLPDSPLTQPTKDFHKHVITTIERFFEETHVKL